MRCSPRLLLHGRGGERGLWCGLGSVVAVGATARAELSGALYVVSPQVNRGLSVVLGGHSAQHAVVLHLEPSCSGKMLATL